MAVMIRNRAKPLTSSVGVGVVSRSRKGYLDFSMEVRQKGGKMARKMGCLTTKRLLSIPDPPDASLYFND